jgi:hypothetical protein
MRERAESSWGRPRRIVNQDELVSLRNSGSSIEAIAEKLGIGYGTVRFHLGNANGRETRTNGGASG